MGCKLAEMPTRESVEKDMKHNVIFIRSFCKQAILPDHCVAEQSYVDYECKPGFRLNQETGKSLFR